MCWMHKNIYPTCRFRWIFLILLCCCLGVTGCRSGIQEINSFDQVPFDRIPSGSLVLLDVDETLVQPSDTYLIHEHARSGRAFMRRFVAAHPEVSDWSWVTPILLRQAQRPLIEPVILDHVRKLRERGIWVIALTAMNVDKIGDIQTHVWRHDHLKTLGFQGDFSERTFVLPGFSRRPTFYHGVLATDLQDKGPVMGSFLDIMALNPTQVVFLDDTKEFVESVERECDKRHIPFQGYHYRGAKTKPWDEKLMMFQGEYLLKHRVWLNDDDARRMM